MSAAADMSTVYTADFYGSARIGVESSAQFVVPRLLKLVPVKTVIDVGCGEGTWLRSFLENGASRVVGVDGAYIGSDSYRLDFTTFVARDLSRPIGPLGRFELAICLEVAEHLPEHRAKGLVEDLCALSDIVLFGAAIPGQGGEHHINEQWQSYWARHFHDLRYLPYDVLRNQLWNCKQVYWWYRQNTLLYVKEDSPYQKYFAEYRPADIGGMLDVVHPELFEPHIRTVQKLRSLMRLLGIQKIRNWMRI
jgi:hypothetical protein